MGRPQRPLDPSAGPVAAFAAELRKVHEAGGSPKFVVMARRAAEQHAGPGQPVSRTALTEAAGGDHLPTWRTVEAFLRACGVEADGAWVARWERARDERDSGVSAGDAPAGDAPGVAGGVGPWGATATGESSAAVRPTGRRFGLLAAATAVVLVLAAGATWLILAGRDDGLEGVASRQGAQVASPSSATTTSGVVVEIQNKYATGSDQLVEDNTPVYLTTKTVARCYERGCIVAGTKSLWSGDHVTATCQATGERITNADETSAGIKRNPARAASNRWYWVTMASGWQGYLPEVWLTSIGRGGLGLPRCPSSAS